MRIYIALLLALTLLACEDAKQPVDVATVTLFSQTGDTLYICTQAHHVWRVDNGTWFYCGDGPRQFVSGTIHISGNN